jgi:hypothetical protein
MSARRSLLALLTLLAAALPASASAAGDAASTQAYIQANYRLVQTAASNIGAGESAIHAVLGRVRQQCPLAAAASPQDPQSTELSNEVIGAMITAAIQRDLPSIRRFVSAAGGLRWSNRGLTNAVRSYVSKLRTLSSLPQPDICTDVRSWAASGFRTVPASTVAFDARFWPSWVALGELPPGLNRFETGAQRSLARRSNQRESQLSEFEAKEVETWGDIMNALNLHP